MKLYLPTIGLSLVLALFLTYWGQVRVFPVKNSVRAQAASQARPVLISEPAQVKAFRIRHGQELIISARMDKNRAWMLEGPLQVQADAYRVDRVLGILSRVTMARLAASEATNLEAYGLHEPHMSIEIEEGADGLWLAVGTTAPVGDTFYAQSSQSEQIVLVPQKEILLLPKSPSDLLDLRVVPLVQDPVHTIEVRQGTASIRLQATSDGGWTMHAPFRAAVDRRVMAEWLDRLTALSASKVSPQDGREGSSSRASRVGSITLTAGYASQSVEFFQASSRTLARRSDQPNLQYELADQDISMLLPDLSHFRHKRWLVE
jgi:uncharacterized protein DUF4340